MFSNVCLYKDIFFFIFQTAIGRIKACKMRKQIFSKENVIENTQMTFIESNTDDRSGISDNCSAEARLVTKMERE
jgi:hypothetical protein